MRLVWSAAAVADLEAISDRASRAAGRLYEAVGWLVDSPFPGMYRHVEGRPNEHVLPVPPHAVFYAIEGDNLTVLRIVDGRRRKQPW